MLNIHCQLPLQFAVKCNAQHRAFAIVKLLRTTKEVKHTEGGKVEAFVWHADTAGFLLLAVGMGSRPWGEGWRAAWGAYLQLLEILGHFSCEQKPRVRPSVQRPCKL